jgi:hypothetical protein
MALPYCEFAKGPKKSGTEKVVMTQGQPTEKHEYFAGCFCALIRREYRRGPLGPNADIDAF